MRMQTFLTLRLCEPSTLARVSLAGDPPVRTVRVHGHDRAFLDVGDGPAILLLHGIGSDRRTWDSVVPRLAAAGFRVVAPDFLGLGASG
jgi:pimeloyl-ACP methyl ester carboxylesterase